MSAVLEALFANGSNTILKFSGAIFTGSSGMTAEGFHSPEELSNTQIIETIAEVEAAMKKPSRKLI